jgi:hypothetical protein
LARPAGEKPTQRALSVYRAAKRRFTAPRFSALVGDALTFDELLTSHHVWRPNHVPCIWSCVILWTLTTDVMFASIICRCYDHRFRAEYMLLRCIKPKQYARSCMWAASTEIGNPMLSTVYMKQMMEMGNAQPSGSLCHVVLLTCTFFLRENHSCGLHRLK